MSTKNIKNSDGLASLGLAVKKFALPALVSAVVALVAGGVYAVNATPANITVCAAKKSGAMRYSPSGACKGAKETKLVLGQQGPAGATGRAAPAGGASAALAPQDIATRRYATSAAVAASHQRPSSRSGTARAAAGPIAGRSS